jgi:hypothetical protein
MKKITQIIGVLIVASAAYLLYLGNSHAYAADAGRIVTLDLEGERYAVPEEYLSMNVENPEKVPKLTLYPLLVHYPDLTPVGAASHRCERKVALSDLHCPYFTIFLLPDHEVKLDPASNLS